jgi:hypothetical protein
LRVGGKGCWALTMVFPRFQELESSRVLADFDIPGAHF